MKFHRKLLERWALIYLEKIEKEGQKAADDYVNRMFSHIWEDVGKDLKEVVQRKRGR